MHDVSSIEWALPKKTSLSLLEETVIYPCMVFALQNIADSSSGSFSTCPIWIHNQIRVPSGPKESEVQSVTHEEVWCTPK